MIKKLIYLMHIIFKPLKMKKNQLEMKCSGSLMLLIISFIIFPSTVFSQVNYIWAVGDGEKIFRDDLNHPSKQENYIWDGKTIKLKGLYNEVLAFQLIVETGAEGAEKLEIAINNPVQKASGKVIGGSTLKYGPAGTIEIFTQHYLNVRDERHTHPAWFYGSEASAPARMTGWIPDALIPVNAKAGLGGFPVEAVPSGNQGFWVDIYLPRDEKEYPSGIYNASVQVFDKGQLKEEIPLEITLLPAFLPDENETNVWLYTSSVYDYFSGLPADQVDQMFKFEAHRHRLDVAGGFSAHRRRF